MNTPLISVVVPCYNQGRYLAESISSLKLQTFQNWECVIVNDGSYDNTASIGAQLALTDSRVRFISQNNHGLSNARNLGLKVTSGEFIQFLDADDLIEQGKFDWQIKLLQCNPEIDIVFGDVRYFPADSPEERRFSLSDPDVPWIPYMWESGKPLLESLLESNIMPVNCPLIRRYVIQSVGLFDEDLRALEDWQYWIRCAVSGMRFHFEPSEDTLALVRMHRSSMSHDNNRMNVARFKVALSIGRLLADAKHKKKNFLNGINGLLQCNLGFQGYHLIRLALANRQIDVIRPIFQFYSFRHPRLLSLGRRVWRTLRKS